MSLILNNAAFETAKELIAQGNFDKKTDWFSAKPTAEEEDHYIEENGWESYGHWFLAINTETDVHLKHHFEFPFGDFKIIFRSALIAIKKRAAQFHHEDIENAADELINLMDQ